MENTLAVILPILETTPARWLDLVQNIPLELLSRRPAEAEWSAFECLAHTLDIERYVFPLRLRAFLAEQDFPAFNPPQDKPALSPESALKLVGLFANLRQDNLALLKGLAPADLDRTARHAALGPVTLEQMLNEWAAHDLDHLIQAERAIMQPFIAACGPWKQYFTANTMT